MILSAAATQSSEAEARNVEMAQVSMVSFAPAGLAGEIGVVFLEHEVEAGFR